MITSYRPYRANTERRLELVPIAIKSLARMVSAESRLRSQDLALLQRNKHFKLTDSVCYYHKGSHYFHASSVRRLASIP